MIYQRFIEDSGIWEIFYSVYGVLYAIIVGFVIVELLSKYEKISQLFEAEINNLQDLRDMILLLNCSKQKKNQILQSIYNYAKWVVTYEWKLMRNHKVKKFDTTPELYEIYRNLYAVEPEKRLDEIALEIALQKLSDITTNRTDRLVLISQYLPLHLKVLIEIMSIMLILGLLLIKVNHFFIHFIMIFSLIFSVLFLRNIINDLDNPFEGMWTLKESLFEDFCSSILSMIKN